MTYCSRCGNLAKEGAQFCDRCGAALSGGQQPYGQPTTFSYTYYPERKDPLIAVILSILLPGVGQMYVGRVGRGLMILITLSLLSLAPAQFLFTIVSFSSFGLFWTMGIVLTIVSLVLYIWQILDAYRLAEDRNRQAPRRY